MTGKFFVVLSLLRYPCTYRWPYLAFLFVVLRIFFFLFGKHLYCTFIWYAEHYESKISKPSYAFVEPGYFSLLIWLTVTNNRSNTVAVQFHLVALSSGTSPFSPFRKHSFCKKMTLSDYLLIFVAWILQYLWCNYCHHLFELNMKGVLLGYLKIWFSDNVT